MPNLTTVLDARVVCGTGGGPDKTILNSPRFLLPAGYRMLCAYMHPPGDPGFEHLRRRAEELEAPLLPVPDRGPWDVGVVRRMLEICRREGVEIWHGHDYKSNLLGLMLRPFWPMRLVTTVHGWVKQTSRTPLYYGIDRACLAHYERVICVSEDLHQRCLHLGVPRDRCLLIENGIDTERFVRRSAPDEAKARFGVPAGRTVVGAVGRLSAEKGFDLLIRAADRLIRDGHDFDLLIAGEGDDESRLRSLIDDLGCRDRVRLLGFLPEPIDLFHAMDIFALSSLREGLPNVVLEAMAMEVAVVATRVAGVPRLIVDGEDGVLVEPGSVDELTQSLGSLLRDPGRRSRLGRAGRETIDRRSCFRTRMRTIGKLYDELLGLAEPSTTSLEVTSS
ncbi:GDP-mannose-dependent alpha-(1-6)-phosphatidylinositol monomannoside mannosyltransferase (plasmid) [Tautonia plasticadhaerens]|uniref:GDP-mannose-dependent alpha-(1-6)-phosphatidylinositol monomannoside mannosyltransferase n=2 Tax=Tautonia plasticadhaerens TaxID=2527974 RepID=A0A518HFX2_9BACT|nr:GDP-mannose-dependent alpha-(1-6)-phosphatidylinositol monomannoside mannosyltransferase [Tautonia plasticadhaerens]